MGMEWQKAITICAGLLIAGCANSPVQIKEAPVKAKYRFLTSPDDAARCMAAGLENLYSYMTATPHTLGTRADVIARKGDLTLFVLSITADQQQSTAVLQFQPTLLPKDGFTEKVTEIAGQCKGQHL
jgi:hypothetical protein